MSYLFVHFKENLADPIGEQVYFGISKDGFTWNRVNSGNPVIRCTKGKKGVRDHTICRGKNGNFFIVSTDLCLANYIIEHGDLDWYDIAANGSKYFSLWESSDLINWSEQRLFMPGKDCGFGSLWAPDIIYDENTDEYLLHWSSPSPDNEERIQAIFYSRTKDFITFTDPKVLYSKEDSGVIDSAMYCEDGKYYLFVKSDNNPARVIMLKSDFITGPFERIYEFDEEMKKSTDKPHYEAPTAYKFNDGRWCLMLDYYGVPGEGQGYVPFIADEISGGTFIRSDHDVIFPYGFKHGTILKISDDEYDRIKQHWPNT